MRIDGIRYKKIGQTRVAGTLCDLLVPVDGRGPLRAEPAVSVDGSVKQAVGASGASKDGATIGDKERAKGGGGKQAGASTARAPAAEAGRALAAAAARYRWPLWLLAVLGVLGALLGCGGHGG